MQIGKNKSKGGIMLIVNKTIDNQPTVKRIVLPFFCVAYTVPPHPHKNDIYNHFTIIRLNNTPIKKS